MKKIISLISILILINLISVLAVETGTVCEVYDDFSGGSLDLAKWEEIQIPQSHYKLAFVSEHYVDTVEQNYHTAQIDLNDKAVGLRTKRTFSVGDVVEFDISYISGTGNRIAVVFFDENTIDTESMINWNKATLWLGYWNVDIRNYFGTFHFKAIYEDGGIINLNVTYPTGEEMTTTIEGFSGENKLLLVTRTGNNGAVHIDYDNFQVCSEQVTNYDPVIDSYTPTETNLLIDETEQIDFTHTSSDQDNNPLTYSWLLDDVEQSTEQDWIYVSDYESAGEHVVKLVVSDGSLETSQEWNIVVNDMVRTEIRCNNIYDDFSSESLDLTKWEEIQDPEGQPLTDEHYIDTIEQNYHVQNIDTTDQRTILNLIGKVFQPEEGIEYDVNYVSGEGNRAMVIFLNGQAVDRLLRDTIGCQWCGSIGFSGQEFDIGNEFGLYHVKLEFTDTSMDMTVTRPDNSIYTKVVPSTPPFNIGFETWSNGKIHSDYDNFKLCELNYEPEIISYLPVEDSITIDEKESISFTHTSIDQNSDDLSYSWRLDEVEQSIEQDWTYNTDSSSSGNHVVSLVVSDGSMEATKNWDITVNNVEEPSPPSSSGGGGGSGGGGRSWSSCVEKWECSTWGACKNQLQTRTCVDATNCGTRKNQPELEQACVVKEEQTVESETSEESNEESGMEGVTGAVVGNAGEEGVISRTFSSIGRGVVNIFKGIGKLFSWIF